MLSALFSIIVFILWLGLTTFVRVWGWLVGCFVGVVRLLVVLV